VALGLGRDGAARRRLGGLAGRPARRLAALMIEFDTRVRDEGPASACRWLLSHFVQRVDVRNVEHVPRTGPLLLVANHPGAYDGFALISGLPRTDIKVLSSEVAIFRTLPHVVEHLIQTDRDAYKRLRAVRTAIKHLEGGGLLLTFGSGFLDPDPLAFPGAERLAWDELHNWSPSIELLLRKAPETLFQAAIIGGVVSPRWSRLPFVRYRRREHDRRKLTEFLQVLYQLTFPGQLLMTPQVAFGCPLTTGELQISGPGAMQRVVAQARGLLAESFAAAW
jgi:hypothetical protein